MTKEFRDILADIAKAQSVIAEAREKCERSGLISDYFTTSMSSAVRSLELAEGYLDEAIKSVNQAAEE